MAGTTEVRKGMVIMYSGEPCLILDREFYKPGKGGAYNRLRLKGLRTGKIVNQTFRSTDSVDEVEVQNRSVIFSYNDDTTAFFMDPVSYETVEIPIEMIPGEKNFLLAEAKYILMTFEEEPLSIQLPAKLTLTVTETAYGGDKGNTSSNALKEATVETGYVVKVPLFISNGDKIIINTETGEYVSKG